MAKAFYFKLALVDDSSFFDFECPARRLELGTTIHQPELERTYHCLWVYRTAEAALSAGMNSSEQKPKLTKTILKCTAWGDSADGHGGRHAYSYVCPVSDIGLKPGFIAFKVLRKSVGQPYAEPMMPLSPKRVRTRLVQSNIRNRSGNRTGNRRSPLEVSLVSQLRSKRRLTSSTMRPKPRVLPSLDYKQTLAKVQAANAKLEEEVAEIERRAAELDLDDL
mmetsp:Transcript_28548/g.50731  ORF Transcript_28548/g.50731 Transcript_28548/m.50731 type:complete len:221 (-) Transcript_28548:94-756(-)